VFNVEVKDLLIVEKGNCRHNYVWDASLVPEAAVFLKLVERQGNFELFLFLVNIVVCILPKVP